MSPGSLFRDLDDFLSLLLQSGVALTSTPVIDVRGSSGHRTITWSTNSSVPHYLFRIESPTVSEYQDWVDSQGYSAILFDGSIIQISYEFRYVELVGHRLLYFPCPFDLNMEFLDTLTLSELIDLYCEERTETVRLRTPVRFDYDPDSHAKNHPASHMTFQWSQTRIAVRSPLSLGHFIQFVFQNFYPLLWNTHEFLNQWPCDNFDTTIRTEEESVLHFSLRDRRTINLIQAQ